MRPKTFNIAAASSPKVIPLDYLADHTSIQVDAIGTVDYTIDYTVENVLAIASPATNADWVAIDGMTGATADAVKKIDTSICGLRVTINSGSGTAQVHVSQPGFR